MKFLKVFTAVSLFIMMMMFVSAASAEHKPGKDRGEGHTPVTICHREGNGGYHEITIDDDAVEKHFENHGDHYPPCQNPTETPSPTVPVETPTVPVETPVPTDVPVETPTIPVETPIVPVVETPTVPPTEAPVQTPVVVVTPDVTPPAGPSVVMTPDAPQSGVTPDVVVEPPVVTGLPDTGVGPEKVQRAFDKVSFVIGVSVLTGFFTGITLQFAYSGKLDN